MGALDELLAKWRENPDSGTTLALCSYLGASRREDLIREVGATAEAWHKEDPQVMLAIGRMYLDGLMLQEAQAALVVAGKLDQTGPSPYRYLGEVLLRRGDAARAEKVLARALQMGAAEPDTRMWHDRSVVYGALQKRVGMRAVADEIERTVPKTTSIPPPTMVAEAAPLATARPPAPRALPSVPPPPKLVPSVPAPVPRAPALPAEYRAEATSDFDLPTGRFDPAELIAQESRTDRDGPTGRFDSAELLAGSSRQEGAPVARESVQQLPRTQSAPPPVARVAARARAPAAPALIASAGPPVAPVRQTEPTLPRESADGKLRFDAHDDAPRPMAETVLEHLTRVGVYDRGGGAPPAWAAPARDRPRGVWIFVAAIVLAAGSGYGGLTYAQKVRKERMAAARGIEAEVGKLLETCRIDDLRKTDQKLSRAFDLDSRSQVAAVLWLRNRVLSALMLPSEPRGIESALSRCKTLEVDDARTAFGRITSFLAEGDLAGAAALLPKWDERSKADPFYQLAAGAMLERAGEVRAIGRYQQAIALDADLLVARVFHAQLATLELGVETGRPVIDAVVKRLGDVPVARALLGLAWALDPTAGELPETARLAGVDRVALPTQLLAIPFLVDARVAARAGQVSDALAALDKGLRVTATPAVAVAIGQLAIDLGDEQLSRQATLRALSYSALYPRARALAARVALLGAHLDEAKKAIQELDPKSPEVAVVRAAAAYESMDLSELDSATAALGSPDGAPFALSLGMGIALGTKFPTPATIEKMSVPSVPWGDLVAVDAALDTGNLELAEKIDARWGARASVPTYALRHARLLRYQGKVEEAARASADALIPGGVTPRVLVERFESLVAKSDIPGARDLLAQYSAVLGPMTEFLKVSADVADKRAPRAKATAARLEPPPSDSPLLYDLIAAKALVAVGDRRGKGLVQALLRKVPKHPELPPLARATGLAH
jgi:tetratricopeptide (TPR) repeat protein